MSMLKGNKMASLVMDVLHLVYKTYHYSPKSRRELNTIGEQLGINVKNPTRVHGTRWSPHTERALKIMMLPPKDKGLNDPGQYSVIFQHMEHLISTSTNADIKGRATNVVKHMKSFVFVAFCHFLLDILKVISCLSKDLQANKVTLLTAISAIKTCILQLESQKQRPATSGHLVDFISFMSSQNEAREVLFQGISVDGSPDHNELAVLNMDSMPLAFRRACSNAITLVTDGMKNRYSSYLDDGTGESKAVNCFDVFHHDKWPDGCELGAYGDEKIVFLVEWFKTVLERYKHVTADSMMELFQSLFYWVLFQFNICLKILLNNI